MMGGSELQGAIEDGGIGSETCSPVALTDDDHVRGGGAFVGFGEGSAEERAHTGHAKGGGSDGGNSNAFRRSRGSDEAGSECLIGAQFSDRLEAIAPEVELVEGTRLGLGSDGIPEVERDEAGAVGNGQ
jgi:hypothetical protein